jgi:hypothetical protein
MIHNRHRRPRNFANCQTRTLTIHIDVSLAILRIQVVERSCGLEKCELRD